ncbi:MAG TPA: hypothetical protein VKF42_10825 [Chitinivibrionales bacterium]|jgi:hypothetical protein|nr:hypothetical protein [Chitinivibrionales bacterium]
MKYKKIWAFPSPSTRLGVGSVSLRARLFASLPPVPTAFGEGSVGNSLLLTLRST